MQTTDLDPIISKEQRLLGPNILIGPNIPKSQEKLNPQKLSSQFKWKRKQHVVRSVSHFFTHATVRLGNGDLPANCNSTTASTCRGKVCHLTVQWGTNLFFRSGRTQLDGERARCKVSMYSI